MDIANNQTSMMKYHQINVTIETGITVIVKVKGHDYYQFLEWLQKTPGIANYDEVRVVSPQKPHAVHKNPSKMTAARLAAGLSQVELADRIGVNRQNIQRWESGTNRPRTEFLKRVGEELGVDWTTLIED